MIGPAWVRASAWYCHDVIRDAVWRHAHLLRRRRHAPSEPRRVLHVTTSFDVGGTQKQIRYLATAPDARLTHSVVEIFPELNFLFRRGERLDPARYVRGGPLGRAIGRAILSRDKRGSHLVQMAKLVRDFQAERPRVVVGWGHEICVTTFVAAALARVPHIVFCIRTVNPDHGWADATLAALLRQAHRRITPRVDLVIVNSSFLRADHAAWLAIDPATLQICVNGIEDGQPGDVAELRARARQDYGIPGDAVVIGAIGRFSPEKGQRALVDAARLLEGRGARAVWLLCGDGPTLPDIRRDAAALGVHNMVLPGRISDIRAALAAMDVFVMPSEFEGMPNAMLEAMAAGLPCVSTTRSGITDIARDGVEALYYEPGDVTRLVQHLESLVTSPDARCRLGGAAAARISEFSVSRFVRCFEAAIAPLVSADADRTPSVN